MPAAFDLCYKNKGFIKTLKKGKNKYQHVCYFKGKSYKGEIKTKKKARKKKK